MAYSWDGPYASMLLPQNIDEGSLIDARRAFLLKKFQGLLDAEPSMTDEKGTNQVARPVERIGSVNCNNGIWILSQSFSAELEKIFHVLIWRHLPAPSQRQLDVLDPFRLNVCLVVVASRRS